MAGAASTAVIQEMLLPEVFPTPTGMNLSEERSAGAFLDELLEFKSRNADDLKELRFWLQDVAFQAARDEDEERRAEFIRFKLRELDFNRGKIVEEMNSIGWRIARSDLLAVVALCDPTGIAGKVKSALEIVTKRKRKHAEVHPEAVYAASYERAFLR